MQAREGNLCMFTNVDNTLVSRVSEAVSLCFLLPFIPEHMEYNFAAGNLQKFTFYYTLYFL